MQKNQLYLVKSGDNGFMEVTETLVSVTGGNVGIGTNDPSDALSIHASNPYVQFTDTDATPNATGYLKCSNGSFYLQADTANNQSNSVIRFDVDGEERATINSYGLQADKIGIGTNDPPAALSIHDAEPFVQFTDTDVNATGYLKCSNGSFYLQADTANNQSNSLISFAVDAEERVRIDSDGNVGIGTDNPSTKLHVNGGNLSVSGGSLHVENAEGISSVGGITYTADSDNNAPDIGQLHKFLVSGTDPALVIQKNGNVGIGTTNPISQLHVSGGLAVGYVTGDLSVKKAADEAYIGISGERYPQLRFNRPGFDWRIYAPHSGLNDSFVIHNYNEARRDLVITQAGNVGIGTTNPISQLHVSGGLAVGYVTGDLSVKKAADEAYIGISGERYPQLRFNRPGFDWRIYAPHSGLNDSFVIHNYNEARRDLVITQAGNVGIGTTDPSTKLDVGGNLLLASGGPSNTSALDSTGSLEIWADRGDGGSSTKITFNVDDSQNVAVMRGVGVGIGTTSYDERLHVVSTSTSQATTNIKNTNTTNGESRGLLISAGNGSSDYSFHARNRAGTESILYARGDGKVGIGTTDPTAPLHVSSSSAPQVHFTRSQNALPSAGGYSALLLGGALSGTTPTSAGSIGWTLRSGITPGGLEGQMYFQTRSTDSHSLSTNMVIDPSGNVGIGTDNPSGTAGSLHVHNGAVIVPTESVEPPEVKGSIYFDGSNFKGWNGTSWVTLG